MIVRHSCSGAPEYLSKILKSSVINAGDGFHEHPTQALLDMFTIREKLAGLRGPTVAIVDIAHSRVARSNIHGLTAMGAKVRVCGPPTMIPPGIECLGAEVTYWIGPSARGGCGLPRFAYSLNDRLLALWCARVCEILRSECGKTGQGGRSCARDASGPMNRGVEISSEVADNTSVILDQVTNGVAVRMAVVFPSSGTQKRKRDFIDREQAIEKCHRPQRRCKENFLAIFSEFRASTEEAL